MPMSYAAFKDYLIDHLWKRGDKVVIDCLDRLIKTAEAELNRTLKIEDRTQLSDTQAVDNLVSVPIDFREMRMLANPYCREMEYCIPNKFFARVQAVKGRNDFNVYTVVNRQIALIGNITPLTPLDLTMLYYMNIPDFQATDTSWLADEYLDVYAYCVLKHTAPFLREDERLATWGALFSDAMSTVMDENDNRKFAGGPLKVHFPRNIR